MLSLEQAQEKILSQISPLPAENLPIGRAAHRILHEDVAATIDLPRFDNSAMDGYALRSADTKSASADHPVRLRLMGKVAAGQMFEGEVSAGQGIRIFTGSVLPSGADAVVMQEDVEVSGAEIVLREPLKPLENVRLRGEDVRSGSRIASAGDGISAPLLGLLSACGVPLVSVGRAPRVALVATGNELREPGDSLQPGEIYESNRGMLAAALPGVGAVPNLLPLVPDSLEETRRALERAIQEADAVITSGGVSVGEFDFVKAALEGLGGRVDFWRVAIKPGKPFVFGQCRGKFIFGLPGNPVSAWVTFLLLVRPALLKMQGARDCLLPRAFGILSEGVANRADRRHFVRVRLEADGRIAVSGPQASHMLGGLGRANGLIDLAPESALEAGARVPVLLWENPAV